MLEEFVQVLAYHVEKKHGAFSMNKFWSHFYGVGFVLKMAHVDSLCHKLSYYSFYFPEATDSQTGGIYVESTGLSADNQNFA